MDLADLVAGAAGFGGAAMMAARDTSAAGRAAAFALWLTALLTVPLPYFVFEWEFAPVLRMVALGGATAAVWWAEGDLVPGLIVAFSLLPGLLYAGLLALVIRRLVRWGRARLGVARLRVWVWAVIVVAFVVAMLPIYRTPLSSVATRANLLHVLQ